MKTQVTHQHDGVVQGFTLVEVQISIAVIALMTAIAVPHVSRLSSRAQETKARTNAQNLISLAGAAAATGVVFTDLDSTVTRLISPQGVAAVSAGLSGTHYSLGSLSIEEAREAKRHLHFVDGQLSIRP